MNITEDISGGC